MNTPCSRSPCFSSTHRSLLFRMLFFYSLLVAGTFHSLIGYELAIVSMFRNEANYLKEWVEYHRTVGVDHFWLYNDRSDDNWQEVLDSYIKEGLVEVIDWQLPPHMHSWVYWQVEAFRAGIQLAQGKAKWVAMIDIDEFIVPMRTKSIPDCLETYFSGASGVYANWKNFGTGGVTIPQGAPILFKLQACSLSHHSDNGIGKSIVRPEQVTLKDIWCPHHFPVVVGAKYVNGSGKEILFRGTDLPTDGHHHANFIRINHYVLRDEAFYQNVRLARASKEGNKEILLNNYTTFSLARDQVITRLIRRHYPEKYNAIWQQFSL